MLIECFNDTLNRRNKIIYSTNNENYLVLVEKDSLYEEYFITKKENTYTKEGSSLEIKSNNLFKRMFDSSIYRQNYISFDSDFYKEGYDISSGAITYFVLKDRNGERYGEFRLSFFIKPIPIDNDIYSYLTKRVLYYSR